MTNYWVYICAQNGNTLCIINWYMKRYSLFSVMVKAASAYVSDRVRITEGTKKKQGIHCT